MKGLESILVPIDFSACSKKALEQATSLAKLYEAKLIILHVIDSRIAEKASGVASLLQEEVKEKLKDQKGLDFDSFLKELPLEGLEITKKITYGIPFKEIIHKAKELRVDLIVLGTHGETIPYHLMFGSTAERVVKKAPCSVFSVRPDGYKFIP